jgi:hypothetical protein
MSRRRRESILQEYWEFVRDLHFKETPYWAEKAKLMGVNPKEELDALEDFLNHPVGICNEADMKERPIEYFIPRSIQARKDYLPLTSSGSTGKKKTVAWSREGISYNARHLAHIAMLYRIPEGMNWLMTGPSYPAPFQPIVQELVKKMKGTLFFAPIETRGLKAHLASIKPAKPALERLDEFLEARIAPCLEYTVDVLEREEIGLLGTALFFLPRLQGLKGFEHVRFVYLGGTEIPRRAYEALRERLEQSGRKLITSYGHYMFGLIFDLPDAGLAYYPPVPLSFLYVVDEVDPFKLVRYGERGRVRFLRADDTLLWCQVERDYAERVAPNKHFNWDGVREVKATF